MGRPATLMTKEVSDAIKGFVTDKKGNYKKRTVAEVRDYLKGLFKKKFLIGSLPGDSSIYKELSKTKEDIENYKDNPDRHLDNPWSIGSCFEFSHLFPNEAVESLIKFKKRLPNEIFSIREAFWIYKLYPLTKVLAEKFDYNHDFFTLELAVEYADNQRISKISREPSYDSSNLDNEYFINPPENEKEFFKLRMKTVIEDIDKATKKDKRPTFRQWKEVKTKKDGK